MKISVNFIELNRHKGYLQDEIREIRRLADQVNEAYDYRKLMNIICDESLFASLKKDLRIIRESIEARAEFLETLEEEVKKCDERCSFIVEELKREQVRYIG